MSRRLSRAAACGAALCFCAFASDLSAAEAPIAREFAIASGGTLIIDAEAARIDVRGGGEGVRVAIRRGEDAAADIEEDFDIAFDASDRQLHVGVRRRGSWLGGLGRDQQLVIEVETPEAFNVELTTSGGTIGVGEVDGYVRAKTSGGSIAIEYAGGGVRAKTSGGAIGVGEVDGHVRAETSGGSILIEYASAGVWAKTSGGGTIGVGEVDGHVRAETSGGSIAIEHAGGGVRAKTSGGSIAISSAKAVDAKTSGGSIQLALTGQPEKDSQLTTSGGSINVHLASDVGLRVHGTTSGGRVRLADDLAFAGDASKKSVSGSLNEGGPELRLRTSGGSILLQAL